MYGREFFWAAQAGVLGLAVIFTTSTWAAPLHSENAAGFVRVTIPVGFSLIANPLDAGANTVGLLFPDMPDGATIYKFSNSEQGYSVNTYFQGWDFPDETLSPGEGAFLLNPGPYPLAITFYGNVPQGTLTNALPQGFSIRSSLVPLPGKLDQQFGFPAEEGDLVYRFGKGPNPQGYTVYSFAFGEWDVSPEIEVGEAFFVYKISPTVWAKSFSVTD